MDTSKQWIKDAARELLGEIGPDRLVPESYKQIWLDKVESVIAKHAPKEEVDTSKERAEFEKWKQTHFDSSLNPCRWDDECEGYAAPNGGFAPEIQSAFEAWMARAEQSTETPPLRWDQIPGLTAQQNDWLDDLAHGLVTREALEWIVRMANRKD